MIQPIILVGFVQKNRGSDNAPSRHLSTSGPFWEIFDVANNAKADGEPGF